MTSRPNAHGPGCRVGWRSWSVSPLVVGAMVALACQRIPPIPPVTSAASEVSRVLTADSGTVGVVGLEPAPDSAGELGVILAGKLSPNPGTIVLLDAVHPQIKVYEARGRLLHAWQPAGFDRDRGSGATTLAVSDSAILLASFGEKTVGLYTHSGGIIHYPEALSINVLAGVALTNGWWLLYGPRSGNELRRQWIHCAKLRHGAGAKVESGFSETVGGGFGIGFPYSLTAMGNSAIVEHRRPDGGVAFVRATCGDDGVQSGLSVQVLANSFAGTPYRDQHGPHLPAGMAALGNSWLIMSQSMDAGAGRTLLRMRDPSGRERRVAEFATSISLLDSRQGHGLLIGAADPWPHVLFIPHALVARQLGPR
jgi:hypothetical protein